MDRLYTVSGKRPALHPLSVILSGACNPNLSFSSAAKNLDWDCTAKSKFCRV